MNRAEILFNYLVNEIDNHDGFIWEGAPREDNAAHVASITVPDDDSSKGCTTFRIVIIETIED